MAPKSKVLTSKGKTRASSSSATTGVAAAASGASHPCQGSRWGGERGLSGDQGDDGVVAAMVGQTATGVAEATQGGGWILVGRR
ncbi:uncharacterized protein A4U43_C10F13740 [Asparagus officinalis]|uniref:Uncharacterized protein n=1 Tax=Asparagus officinalis TaxID=4686 RepID=A0A5P1E307_ASPOF|nr:uncharacterized protein A4U43_C10F13740 [Asparagus officinalis]